MGIFDKFPKSKKILNSVSEGIQTSKNKADEFAKAHLFAQTEEAERILKRDTSMINYQDNGLIWALRKRQTDIFKLQIESGVDCNFQDKDGNTALIYASNSGYKEAVELLIKAGANLDIQDTDGLTALMVAVRKGEAEVIELLIKAGTNLDIQDKDGDTALMLAAHRGYMNIVELLIEGSANPNIQNTDVSTALMFAVNSGNKDIVEMLIKSGADLNIQDGDGSTALMFAVNNGNKDFVEILINSGADLEIQHKNGYTAFTIATDNEEKDILDLFTNNNEAVTIGVDAKENTNDCYYGVMETEKVEDQEVLKAVVESLEQEREVRKQKAKDIFFDFKEELRNPIYGEGTSAKIRSIMHQMSSFSVGRLDLTDADLESAQTLLKEIKTDWRKVEIECFVELESETKERKVVEEYREERRDFEYSEKNELIKSIAKNTKSAYNALMVEINKEEVKNHIDKVSQITTRVITEDNIINKWKDEKVIDKKTAFALKLVTPLIIGKKTKFAFKLVKPHIEKKLIKK